MSQLTVYNRKAKIWSGPKKERLFNANCSVGRAALHMLRSKLPNSVCQISDTENTTLTNATVCSYAIRVAQHFRENGLTQDDVVGFVAPNTTLLMPVLVACWLNCTPHHTINETYEEATIKELFKTTKPKYIFCDGAHYLKIKSATSELNAKIYTLCNHIEGIPKVEQLLEPNQLEAFYQPETLKYGSEQTMGIYCTSGTSGLPKGACISNARMAIDLSIGNGSTVLFSFSTPSWGTGIMQILCNVLMGGTRIITTKPYTPEYMLEIIRKYKVSFLGASPEQMPALSHSTSYTKEAMESVNLIYLGGAHCSTDTLNSIRAQLTNAVLVYGYGTSEFGGIANTYRSEPLHSVGQLAANVELKIADLTSGERLGPGEVGEICVRNDCKWLGYYHDAVATKNALDGEEWLRTGDMGYMDKEHNLFVVERCKDILKYCGCHYSPQELEETIAQLPDVEDVCVFGVYNESCGDQAAAAIVKRADSVLSEQQVIDFVAKQHEAKHKQINYGVFFVPKISRNINGKILRYQMKEICLAAEKCK